MSYTFSIQPTYLRDGQSDDNDLSNLLFEARLRSGDYFTTLSTELEKLAELLRGQDIPESDFVERLSRELAYLDKHYKIKPKG